MCCNQGLHPVFGKRIKFKIVFSISLAMTIRVCDKINSKTGILNSKLLFFLQVYEKLKKAVMKIDPALIKEVINKNKSKQDLRKLKSLVASGKSPDRVGRFKKISSKRTQY